MTDSFVDKAFIVAGSKPWNRRVFDEEISRYPGRWIFVSEREQLTVELLNQVKPRYVFFLHWSWLVPNEIIDQYECVCFHMADVPYGRGGSPLQNLIVRGHSHTKLTALRMTHGFDEGPVYLKEDLRLEGNAEEIYIRATYLSAKIINRFILEELHPIPQSGDVVVFNRRKPAQSMIPELGSLTKLHDFIRMLDAEGYPKAFLDYGGFRYEFSRAVLYDGRIVADVKISRLKDHLL
ncbi:MAG: methionyl-tRNA formyltransferase [Lentisphaerae bacterium]|nr:methionyl-tRNA formyltransferase [Lentisphaerota bacterium]